MAEPLFVEERRRVILEHLRQYKRVSVNALSDELQVSAVTIRQDLRALEEEGLLERTYGGAVLRAEPLRELSFDVRQRAHPEVKAAIGAAAAAHVCEGYSVALDASTTALALLPYIKKFERLTVVTNSLIVAQRLLDSPQIQVFLPGGRLRRDSISLVGQPEALPNMNLNVGFFGSRGISLVGGITDTDYDEVPLKQAMIARCIMTIVVADGSKWGYVAPYPFVELNQVDRIITSASAPSDLVQQFQEQGIPVDLVPEPNVGNARY